jgi:ATP-dependent DNA helicase RecG
VRLNDIKELAKQGESNTLEFKSSTAKLKAAFETISAFLNKKGGTVLIGVKDSGELIGQDVTDNTRKEIANEIKKIEPPASVDVQYVTLENKKVIVVIYVEAGIHAPYVYDGRPHQRDESETTKMSQQRYEQLLVERGHLNHDWEDGIALNYKIKDLDEEEIRRAVRQGATVGRVPAMVEAESIEKILESWSLIKNLKLNNAAVVLFAKKTMPHYPQCHLKLGRFKGADMLGDLADNKEFFGNAFRLFGEANSFIAHHLPIASSFQPGHLERIDRPALPVLAVREALVNALCHRNYSNRSSAITVAIFDDRMEIWNPGKLPSALSLDDLKKKHKSEPPNKIIAKVFYDRKYFDGWGTGINKIFNLCHENNVPEPTYREYSGGVEIVFKFNEPLAPVQQVAIQKTSEISSLNIRQEEIFSIIKQLKTATIQQIMDELKQPPSKRMIQKDLRVLKEKGLIILGGSGNKAMWLLK